MDNEMMVSVAMPPDMLRAVIKSLSIGCDQLSKKLGRVVDDGRRSDVFDEYIILMNAKRKAEGALLNAISENPFS